jgi:hypothetical protein
MHPHGYTVRARHKGFLEEKLMDKNRPQGHAGGKKGDAREAAGKDSGTGHPEKNEQPRNRAAKDETVLGKINDDPKKEPE